MHVHASPAPFGATWSVHLPRELRLCSAWRRSTGRPAKVRALLLACQRRSICCDTGGWLRRSPLGLDTCRNAAHATTRNVWRSEAEAVSKLLGL